MLKLMCCFLRLKVEGADEMNRGLAEAEGKPRCLMMNHTSFMDALFTITLLRSSFARQMKSLASAHLFAMPILGALGIASGHFAVPFKSQATKAEPGVEKTGSVADFSVDKEAVAKVVE